jgi:signal transduction histidine kinase
LGYPLENWLEQPDFWSDRLHPDDRERVMESRKRSIARDEAHELEYRCLTANGETIWLRDKTYLARDGHAETRKLRGLFLDITDSKEAETALRAHADRLATLTSELTATNATLEKRNQELDQFVYVASHDLKSPLRAIANIAGWLSEDLEDKLTEETAYQLNLLQGRVHRMEKLIDGLLLYYRAGRGRMHLERVEVGELLEEVIDFLDPGDRFSVRIAPDLPTIETVRVLLAQVFTNLIGNALKHHDKERGTIEIGARRREDRYEFSVSDDGPGIDPQFHDRIFSLFQTLQPHTSENTGIGLTLVKKIVESEGGEISIDSREGQGTTIRFTWPVGE